MSASTNRIPHQHLPGIDGPSRANMVPATDSWSPLPFRPSLSVPPRLSQPPSANAANPGYAALLLTQAHGPPVAETAPPLGEQISRSPTPPPSQIPTFLQRGDAFPHTFGSTPVTVHEFPEGRGPLEYTGRGQPRPPPQTQYESN
jgi:hypothetical protein